MASNYIYKYIVDENNRIIYPRTVLSAIDIITTNGLLIQGDKLSITYATKEQIHQGTPGVVLSADGLKEAIEAYSDTLLVACDGIYIHGGTIGVDPADTEAITARSGDLTKVVTNGVLGDTLNIGRAVNITPTLPPTSSDFTSVTEYTEVIGSGTDVITEYCIKLQKTNVPSNNALYGCIWNSVCVVSGRRYLYIADFKNVGAVPAWVNVRTSTANSVTAIYGSVLLEANSGTWTRVASLSTVTEAGGLYIGTRGAGTADIRVKHFCIFDVTDLSDSTINTLASMEHPESLKNRYLVQQDSVCPWIKEIPIGTASAYSIQAGLAYTLHANDGAAHMLMVDTLPSDAYGKDAYITIFLDDTSTIQTLSPLSIVDALVPNAANNCVVKFRDGYARMYVTDTDYGYVVSVNSGISYGTLYYGLYISGEDYIQFAHSTDEQDCVVVSGSSAVPQTVAPARNIAGNGVDKTIINFNNNVLKPAKAVTITNATLKNASITGGTVAISGSMVSGTVSQSAGTVKFTGNIGINGTFTLSGSGVLQVTGSSISGGIINLSGTKTIGTTSLACTNVWFKNGYSGGYGGVFVSSNTKIDLTGCTFTTCRAVSNNGGAFSFRPGKGTITNVLVDGCTAGRYGGGFECSYNRSTTNVITASTISHCLGQYGVFCTYNNKTQMIDSLIEGNTSTYGSFFIDSAPCDAEIINTIIRNNTVTNGGGIYISAGNAILTDTLISQNVATDGGGIYGSGAGVTITATGTTISGCSASVGGAIYIASVTNATMSDSLITGNYSSTGSDIYIASGSVTINNSTISNNYGAVYVISVQSGTTTLNNILISGNTSNNVAPAIYCTNSNTKVYVNNCTVINNLQVTATQAYYRGIFYCSSQAQIILNSTVITGNTTPDGYGTAGGLNGGTASFTDCNIDGTIQSVSTSINVVGFTGTNKFTGCITGTPSSLYCTIASGATLDLQNNINNNVIVGSTISAGGMITIINKDGEKCNHLARSVTGSTITNMGLWLPHVTRLVIPANTTASFRGCMLCNNTGTAEGGGLNANGAGTNIEVIGATIANNKGASRGGAVAIVNYPGTVSVAAKFVNCLITKNRTYTSTSPGGYFGAFSCYNGATVSVIGCTITGNTSADVGNGFYMTGNLSKGTVSDCYIAGNQGNNGAAIYTSVGATLHVIRTIITDNISTNSAGTALGINSPNTKQIYEDCTINGTIFANTSVNNTTVLEFRGTNIFTGTITGTFTFRIEIASNAVIDLQGNNNTIALRGGTISAAGPFTVIDKNGTAHPYSSTYKTNSQIKNDGSWI